MKSPCNNKCLYWSEAECVKRYFEVQPFSSINYGGECDHFQAYVVRKGTSCPIIDECGNITRQGLDPVHRSANVSYEKCEDCKNFRDFSTEKIKLGICTFNQTAKHPKSFNCHYFEKKGSKQ